MSVLLKVTKRKKDDVEEFLLNLLEIPIGVKKSPIKKKKLPKVTVHNQSLEKIRLVFTSEETPCEVWELVIPEDGPPVSLPWRDKVSAGQYKFDVEEPSKKTHDGNVMPVTGTIDIEVIGPGGTPR